MRLPFQRKNQPAAARDSPKPLRSDAFLLEAMDAWGDVVYRVALAQTGSPSDADDVFQDVFMRLLENDTAFESDEHLKAWLLRVTVNRCRDLARLTWNRRTEGFTREHADIPAPTSGRSWARCRPTCASRCTCSTSRATPPKRSRASRDVAPAPCEPASTAPASSCAAC